MKILGYVNRYNRGIIKVQKELKENGNGKAIFDLTLITAFKVIEPISARAKMKLNERQIATLEFCKTAKSREEIFAFLGLSNQTKNYVKYVQPLIDAKMIIFTKPGKSDVRGQQYVLSKSGGEIIEPSEE